MEYPKRPNKDIIKKNKEFVKKFKSDKVLVYIKSKKDYFLLPRLKPTRKEIVKNA